MLSCLPPLILVIIWAQPPRCFAGTLLLPLSPPETDPQILERWRYADEDHLGRSFRAKDFDRFSDTIEHIGLVSVCLSSSAKSMRTSAAPYLEIRNPIVV